MTAGNTLCLFGLHWFEKEPSEKELIKETGSHKAFWSEGIQKGVKHCVRSGCPATKKVWRTGWVGIGGKGTRWKKRQRDEMEKSGRRKRGLH